MRKRDNKAAALAEVADLGEAIRPAVEEANSKRVELHIFLRETYSTPFVALVALVAAVKNLEQHAAAQGFDVPEITQFLIEAGSLTPRTPRD